MELEVVKNSGQRSRSGSFFSNLGRSSLSINQERKLETVSIQLFDGKILDIEYDIKITGYILLEKIAEELGDSSKAPYLGLLIEPLYSIPRWMDLKKSVSKQISDCKRLLLLRIKFYPADPITEMVPKVFAFLLFYQLLHDLSKGRLLGKTEDHCALIAYSVIVDEESETISKLKSINYRIRKDSTILPGLDKSMEIEIKALLVENSEMTSDEALCAFLKLATRLETYGIEPFLLKDQRGSGICVGFNCHGLSVFKSNQRINFFKWESILKVNCDGKNVIANVKIIDEIRKIGFKCETHSDASFLYNRIEEAAAFFSLGETWRKSQFTSDISSKKSSVSVEETSGRKSPPTSDFKSKKSITSWSRSIAGTSFDSESSIPSSDLLPFRITVRENEKIFNSFLIFPEDSQLDIHNSPIVSVSSLYGKKTQEIPKIVLDEPNMCTDIVTELQESTLNSLNYEEFPQNAIDQVIDTISLDDTDNREFLRQKNRVSVSVHHFPKYPFYSSLSISSGNSQTNDVSLS